MLILGQGALVQFPRNGHKIVPSAKLLRSHKLHYIYSTYQK